MEHWEQPLRRKALSEKARLLQASEHRYPFSGPLSRRNPYPDYRSVSSPLARYSTGVDQQLYQSTELFYGSSPPYRYQSPIPPPDPLATAPSSPRWQSPQHEIPPPQPRKQGLTQTVKSPKKTPVPKPRSRDGSRDRRQQQQQLIHSLEREVEDVKRLVREQQQQFLQQQQSIEQLQQQLQSVQLQPDRPVTPDRPATPPPDRTCRFCQQIFETRNQLFKHLRKRETSCGEQHHRPPSPAPAITFPIQGSDSSDPDEFQIPRSRRSVPSRSKTSSTRGGSPDGSGGSSEKLGL